ncbi:hypothetical protein [Parasphingorhabdus cellanae]|uniref:Lipoprotein n=1 Tax=Parasphingorhabdus cellanae TaxID=2806553 RepID=A0ABX7T7P7_9SPHN|nr:hypothetical protein [Parasphingorhabdus cellanae]QTD56885.1 hypothetical protein J4G78_04745 [Parasphingorhabdus cellanae]
MIKAKKVWTVAILSLAVVSLGTPVHACGLHGDFDGGFGMQRFNPFQAEPSDNSSSWSASLNQQRKMSPMPKTQDTDAEPVEKAWTDTQNTDEQEPVSRGTPIGRRDDASGGDQAIEQENGQYDEQQNLTTAATSDLDVGKATFH